MMAASSAVKLSSADIPATGVMSTTGSSPILSWRSWVIPARASRFVTGLSLTSSDSNASSADRGERSETPQWASVSVLRLYRAASGSSETTGVFCRSSDSISASGASGPRSTGDSGVWELSQPR